MDSVEFRKEKVHLERTTGKDTRLVAVLFTAICSAFVAQILLIITTINSLFCSHLCTIIQMQLSIKSDTGKTYTIEADPTDKINDIKSKITEKEGIPSDKQRLIVNGTHLVHYIFHDLTRYDIEDGATIYVGKISYHCSLFRYNTA